jgi:DNA polymerase/3'-5' exonuclease PolX
MTHNTTWPWDQSLRRRARPISATGTRLALADADVLAADLLRQIDGEAHVVGSVRRRKPNVGDIELLVHVDAVVRIAVAGPLLPGEYETVKGGSWPGWKFWQLRHREQGFQVDLYRFDGDNRGSLLLIRTGPAEFSQRFVQQLRQQGLYHEGGYIWGDSETNNSKVRCPSEAVAFQLAGMPWAEPERR